MVISTIFFFFSGPNGLEDIFAAAVETLAGMLGVFPVQEEPPQVPNEQPLPVNLHLFPRSSPERTSGEAAIGAAGSASSQPDITATATTSNSPSPPESDDDLDETYSGGQCVHGYTNLP